jgi:hypothetical protein
MNSQKCATIHYLIPHPSCACNHSKSFYVFHVHNNHPQSFHVALILVYALLVFVDQGEGKEE